MWQCDNVTALSQRRSPPNWGEAGVRDCNSPTATLPLADEAFCGRSSKWNLLFSLLFDLPKVNITNISSCLTSKLSPKVALGLGTDGPTKMDEFSEKFQTAFDLPPIFGKVAMTRNPPQKPQHLTIYSMYGMVTFLALTRPNQPIWCMAMQEISSKYEYQRVITNCSGQTFGAFERNKIFKAYDKNWNGKRRHNWRQWTRSQERAR